MIIGILKGMLFSVLTASGNIALCESAAYNNYLCYIPAGQNPFLVSFSHLRYSPTGTAVMYVFNPGAATVTFAACSVWTTQNQLLESTSF